MTFEWDERKNKTNFQIHGIAFENVPPLFESDNLLLIDYDDREDYGEDRWIGIGLLRNHVVVIVFTELDLDTIRLISARKANRNERKRYYAALRN